MKKEISPIVTTVVIAAVVVVVAIVLWTGTQRHDKLPDKPPSGPITLPPSQQNRTMPGGTFSGAMPGASGVKK